MLTWRALESAFALLCFQVVSTFAHWHSQGSHYNNKDKLPTMPRTKRTLAETDSNAEALAPAPKRTSTGKGPEDENDVPATAAATRRGGKPPVGALLDQLASPAKQDKTAKQASATSKKSVAKKPEPKDASSTTTRSQKAPVSSCWFIALAARLLSLTDFEGASHQAGQICHHL